MLKFKVYHIVDDNNNVSSHGCHALSPNDTLPKRHIFKFHLNIRNPQAHNLLYMKARNYISGVANSISEGDIFIYSCFAQLISFEIDLTYSYIRVLHN